ncbi:MAG: histidinol dehydrogenase [Promethearchaeota archaeon]|nr:MAG: histidinol dehydrogenase [Candidatus Lokiarchaeota archaeon]
MINLKDIQIIDSKAITSESIGNYIPRIQSNLENILNQIWEIINKVKAEGDQALLNFTEKFDNIKLTKENILVTANEVEDAYSKVNRDLLDALKFSKENLIKFHKAQLRKEWNINICKGVQAGQIYRPIESVGIYVPGGRAIYPSTVLMAATPAFVAGVKEIILCSPPQKDGKIAPEILVAAKEFNIQKIFKVGGAQAIAAMAYGTDIIPNVLKIVGPGNKWVNGAKQLLSNIVAIDNPAGPSEILIIADKFANYENVIIDFISQIEHDPDNIGIIVSTSDELINKVKINLKTFIKDFPRKKIITEALKNSMIIKAANLGECTRVCNLIAPEHLEILTENSHEVLEYINNAGAIFLGPHSPVPLGDYSAGTNHILPTGGYAKTYSGLNSLEFIKCIDVLECTSEGLKNLSKSAITIAKFENLDAHASAIQKRLEEKE